MMASQYRNMDTGKLAEELDRVAQDRDAMFAERMKLKEELANLRKERDNLEKERDRLARDNNHLAEDVAFAKKRALHVHETEIELKKVRDERNAMSKELCDMNIKYNNSLKELVAVKQDFSTVKIELEDARNNLLLKDSDISVLQTQLRDVSTQQYDAELCLKNHLCVCEERIAELARINESLEEKIERLKEEKSRILVYMYEKYHGGTDNSATVATATSSQTASIRSGGAYDAKSVSFKTLCGGKGGELNVTACPPGGSASQGNMQNDSAKVMSMEFQMYRQNKKMEMMGDKLQTYDPDLQKSYTSAGSGQANVAISVSISSRGSGRSDRSCDGSFRRSNESGNNNLLQKSNCCDNNPWCPDCESNSDDTDHYDSFHADMVTQENWFSSSYSDGGSVH